MLSAVIDMQGMPKSMPDKLTKELQKKISEAEYRILNNNDLEIIFEKSLKA